MKYADYIDKLKTTQLVRIKSQQFHPAQFTVPTEEELASGVVPIQILPAFWTLDVSFDGPKGGYNGAENVELGEEAKDSDIVAALKAKWDLSSTPWEPISESIEAPEVVEEDAGKD